VERMFKCPLWVEIVYRALEWVDYKILSRASSRTVWWRNDLLDKYCRCSQCQERNRTGAA